MSPLLLLLGTEYEIRTYYDSFDGHYVITVSDKQGNHHQRAYKNWRNIKMQDLS